MPNLEMNANSIAKRPVQVPVSLCSRWGGRIISLCQYRPIAAFALFTTTSWSLAAGCAVLYLIDVPLNFCLESVFRREWNESKLHKFVRLAIGLGVVAITAYKVNTWILGKLMLPLGRASLIVITIAAAVIPACIITHALIGGPNR